MDTINFFHSSFRLSAYEESRTKFETEQTTYQQDEIVCNFASLRFTFLSICFLFVSCYIRNLTFGNSCLRELHESRIHFFFRD
jgi:hypothetical protein